MKYRKLGHSGLEVSEVGIGSWLTYGERVANESARECVQRAIDLGINFFDTAPDYGNGKAEAVLGEILPGFPRHSYVLSTKVYWHIGSGPNDWGLSRKHIFEQFEISRRRLRTDYFDLFLCHRYDVTTPLAEVCRAMHDLVTSGRVLYWGVSEWSAAQIAEAVLLCRSQGWNAPVCNQAQYSAVWRSIEASVLPVCEALGLGVLCWSPLAMGIMTGKYTSLSAIPQGTRGSGPDFAFETKDDTWLDMPYFNQKTLDAVQTLKPVAQEAGCSMAQLALAWCLRHPAIASVTMGASRPDQVTDNAGAADLAIPMETLAKVTEQLRTVANFDAGTSSGAIPTATTAPNFGA